MRIDTLIVGKEEIAQMLGVSTPTVDGYVRAGCPVARKGGPGVAYQFDTAAVHRWLMEKQKRVAGAGDADMARERAGAESGRRRAAVATAELKEYELAQKRGEMITVPVVLAALEDELGVVRSRLVAIPSRAAHELATTSDPDECERILAREINDALSQLSAAQVVHSAAA